MASVESVESECQSALAEACSERRPRGPRCTTAAAAAAAAAASEEWSTGERRLDRQTVSVERCDEAGREAGMQGRGRSQAIRQRTDDATPPRRADYYLLRRRGVVIRRDSSAAVSRVLSVGHSVTRSLGSLYTSAPAAISTCDTPAARPTGRRFTGPPAACHPPSHLAIPLTSSHSHPLTTLFYTAVDLVLHCVTVS